MEVCVEVVRNVAEMENGKIKQKRDHDWVRDCTDLEPAAKKQAVEDKVARNELEVVQDSVENETCANVEPRVEQKCENKQTESLGNSDVNCLDEESVRVGPGDTELDASGEKDALEVSNDLEIKCVVEKPVENCLNEMEVEASIEHPVRECPNEMEKEAFDVSEHELSIPQPVSVCLSEMELEPTEAVIESEPVPPVQQPVKECLSEIKTDTCSNMQSVEALGESDPEPSVEQAVKECSREMELTEALNESEAVASVLQPVKECPSEIEMEAGGKMQPTEALNESEPEPSVLQTTEALNDGELVLSADQSVEERENEIVIDPCTKKEVKESSNDDICSEVSNPNVSPCDHSSFQTVSQPDEKLVTENQALCGEITSVCSGNSSNEASSNQEENGSNDISVAATNVVIEAPRDAPTRFGVRKIIFKFNMQKEDNDSQPSASASNCMDNGYNSGIRKAPRLSRKCEKGFHERDDGKVVPDIYPSNVKKLLSTGILDGAKVKYISEKGELIGIIKDCGYLCGCETCNFSDVLRASEFEEHAGVKTRHPNNHIFLENGKPIYSIIQALKTAPLRTVDEEIRNIAGSSVNEELLQAWKASLQRNMDRDETDNSYHTKLMDLYHSTTSDTREADSSPFYGYHKSVALEPQTFVSETMKERKCVFKKPRVHASHTSAETKQCAEGGRKKRDNDLHRLLFMPNGLPDGTELAYYARGKTPLGGYKRGNGIVCSHCDEEISPSQFEAHAGWASKRQPYRHICISNGLTLHDIAMLLANGQSLTTSNSDDMCAVCGDRGELIICDGCPRAFHAACLEPQGVSCEEWHCPYCRDNIGSGRKAAAESRPIVIRLTRVVKAREYEAGGCVICRVPDFSAAEFDDRTVMLCDQCEKEYHVGCLRDSGRCDLKALPSDKWFCCDHCDTIHGAIQDMVANGAAVISSSVMSLVSKKQIEKGVTYGAPNEIRWRMLSGKSRYPEHLLLLSRASAIFRECFDPIVAKSGRDLIPVMVYGRNISGQDFGGIYCVVLMVGSVVVSAGLLRIFGRGVAELPLVATSRQYQGKGYFQALFFCIEELLLSLGVELLVLPAAEEAELIWTKKLGFRKMSDERYTQFARDIQLTIFKGTSMLERDLRRTL